MLRIGWPPWFGINGRLAPDYAPYKTLEHELIFLQKKPTSQATEGLPAHENIRGAEYYQERCLS